MFNGLCAFWPEGYMHGTLEKRHQNDDYLKQAITCTLSSQFPECSMDIGQSHLTDVGSSVKIKMIKNLKTPLQSVFP